MTEEAEPLLRVKCREHGGLMGRIVPTDEGPSYWTVRPILPGGKLLRSESGNLTRGLAGKAGHRLYEAVERAPVLLDSYEAEHFAGDSETWGSLPAWCDRCSEERWVTVDKLRVCLRRGQKILKI